MSSVEDFVTIPLEHYFEMNDDLKVYKKALELLAAKVSDYNNDLCGIIDCESCWFHSNIHCKAKKLIVEEFLRKARGEE